jgi:hypothetical protein
MSLLRLLGEGPEYYVTPLGSSYFVNVPRSDGEASKPVTNQCKGAKLVVPKESPTRPIQPESVKAILDARDVQVQARHNNSKKTAKTSFAPTWTIILQSQGDVKSADPADVGFWDKISEMRPPFRFLPPAEITDTSTQKVADPDLADNCDAGKYCSEVLLWAQAMYPTLASKICQHRRILPEPETVSLIRDDATRDSVPAKLRELLQEKMEHCKPAEATSCTEMHKYIQDHLGDTTGAERAAAGLGPERPQFRGGPREAWKHYYRYMLAGTSKPIRIKPA